ncbi:hypothetical protein V8G54_001423 [Vigna mungo]|uniref:Uncharacterized protein n=1 Tax=Vigna mungo TaxID=3915 RepID=A0AAQ3SBT3_VIGMU
MPAPNKLQSGSLTFLTAPDCHGVKVYDKGRASGVVNDLTSPGAVVIAYNDIVSDYQSMIRDEQVQLCVGWDVTFEQQFDKPRSMLREEQVELCVGWDVTFQQQFDKPRSMLREEQVELCVGWDVTFQQQYLWRNEPTKPLAYERGRSNAPKGRSNNDVGGKTRALEKWRIESTSMIQQWMENHFNGGESFEGRNFNDGERVLKDLSAKGERDFRKGGEGVS